MDVDALQRDKNDIDGNNEMSGKYSHHRDVMRGARNDNLLSWNDVLPLSIYAATCLFGAIIVSTYEDFDVTHTRPSPSTLRLPTSSISKALSTDPAPSWRNSFNFFGAATRGLGWGPSNRGIQSHNDGGTNDVFFEEWYGSSAMTLQWKPSYNEIMLQHRLERVPRWNDLKNGEQDVLLSSQTGTRSSKGILSNTKRNVVTSKEQLQQAVIQLYHSLDELDELKLMADDYMWEEMKYRLNPTASAESESGYSLPIALEYSMDILKSMPSYYAAAPDDSNSNQINLPNKNIRDIPDLIGFDWGSCAWRHCGAKADAQEAIAELQSSVGMLEPFECRFIIGKCQSVVDYHSSSGSIISCSISDDTCLPFPSIIVDIVERSIRDVLVVLPDDLKPSQNGVPMQVKPYKAYVPQVSSLVFYFWLVGPIIQLHNNN